MLTGIIKVQPLTNSLLKEYGNSDGNDDNKDIDVEIVFNFESSLVCTKENSETFYLRVLLQPHSFFQNISTPSYFQGFLVCLSRFSY